MIDRSKLFQDAWKIQKLTKCEFGFALKKQWDILKEKDKELNFEFLVKYLKKNIDYYVNYVCFRSSFEKEDVKQMLLMKLFKVYKKYNKKYEIKTFFVNVLFNCSKDILVKSKRKRRQFNNNLQNFDQDDCFVDYRDCYSEKEIQQCLESYLEKFEGKSKEVYKNIILGVKIKDIAKDLNTSSQNVINIIKRKIRPELMNNNFREILGV